MPTTYVVDGYNLLHAMGILAGKVKPLGLARARLQLQEFLAQAFGAEAGQVTIVFDAAHAPPKVAREQAHKGLTLLFAVGAQEADDLIEALIARSTDAKHLIVVSSDHRLQTAARRKGAQPMTCAEFLDHLERRRQPTAAPAERPDDQKLSEGETKYWLQEFAGLADEPELKEALERFDFEDFDVDKDDPPCPSP